MNQHTFNTYTYEELEAFNTHQLEMLLQEYTTMRNNLRDASLVVVQYKDILQRLEHMRHEASSLSDYEKAKMVHIISDAGDIKSKESVNG
jgi:hypothetical protein